MPRKKLHGAALAAWEKKHGKRGAKKGAKKGTKKKGTKKKARPVATRSGTFLQGYHAGHGDVLAHRPLRKTGARKDDYSRGYRAGVAQGRVEKKRRK